MRRSVMEAFTFASPDEWSDDFSSSDVSFIESDADEGEEEENVWTLQPELPHTFQLQAEAKYATDKMMEATCSGFSMDRNWLAIGTRRGPVQIYSVGDGRLAFTLDVLKGGLKRWPCTALCIRPSEPGDSSYNVLLSCDLSGQIHYWHMTSGMHLGLSKEQGNSIYTLDFHPAGVKYATSGSDCKVRVYDAPSCTLLQTLSGGNGTTTAGHSNRVFAVKWHPEDVHAVLSGGWDNTIQIWDLRVGHSVRSIYGPKVCGDAIDIRDAGNVILSGSWRRSNQLQEWDFGSGKLLSEFAWPTTKEQPCQVYAAKYGKGVSRGFLAAGGSGSNETCLFCTDTGQMVARLPVNEQATHSLSFSTDGSLLAATAGNMVSVVDLEADLSPHPQESEAPRRSIQSEAHTSDEKTRKLSKTTGETKGETKLNVQQTGARLIRHRLNYSPSVTSSNKIRLPNSSSFKADQARLSRSSGLGISKPDVKRPSHPKK